MRLQYNGDLHADGDVVAYSTTISDARLKDNIKPLESSLDKIMNLKGVEYNLEQWKQKRTERHRIYSTRSRRCYTRNSKRKRSVV